MKKQMRSIFSTKANDAANELLPIIKDWVEKYKWSIVPFDLVYIAGSIIFEITRKNPGIASYIDTRNRECQISISASTPK